MQNNFLNKSSLFFSSNHRLRKKSIYSGKIINSISKLNFFFDKKQKCKNLSRFLNKQVFKCSSKIGFLNKRGSVILYSICFSFSAVNTFMYVLDSLGNLKLSCSGGLFGFKGKSKKRRFQVLKLFFKKLRELKTGVLKNNPVELVLRNVGFQKKLIIQKLKKLFFVRVIKNHEVHSYNGCRKKKKFRK